MVKATTKVLVPLNAPCPCSSGRNYEECCSDKLYEWLVDGEGGVFLSIPVYGRHAAKFLKNQVEKLLQRYAKQLELDQYVFPGMSSERFDAIFANVAKRAGVDPALIYATKKTGIILTEENEGNFTPSEIKAFRGAVNEYRRRARNGNPPEI